MANGVKRGERSQKELDCLQAADFGPVKVAYAEALAASLWEDEEADDVVRHRLDVVLGKLRRRLEDAGVRRDLVTSHHTGYLELVLYPGDQAHDRQG